MIFNPGALVGYVGLLILILETPVLSIPTLLERTAPDLAKVTLSGATESADSTPQSSRVLNDVGAQMRLEVPSGPYDILEAQRDTHRPVGKDDGHAKHIQNGQGTNNIPQGKKGEPEDGNGNHFNLNPGMIDHPGKYKIRRDKVYISIEDFVLVSEKFFQLDNIGISSLKRWLEAVLVGKSYEIPYLVDHVLAFMKTHFSEKFFSFCEGSSELQFKNLFMKKFGLLTLEEGIELYNPHASEDQISSIQLFALGTKALDREASPLQTYWYFQHLEEMLKHWNDVSSPGKDTVLISWEDFQILYHKFHFDIEAPSSENLADYLKKLAIWDINHEKEEISIHKLMHYTFLYFYEKNHQFGEGHF
ncbi:hypothetical protein PtB15_11B559 [Puccinia triticina]|nr:hypothetical protein PtB15_11B559 [Puccinia triticina]